MRKMATYDLTPVDVPKVKTSTGHKDKTAVPESLKIFEELKLAEPRSMMGPAAHHLA